MFMTEYLVGTSGWQYDHWRGVFYPADLAKHDWFDYYARQFSTVEINNTFYRLPRAKTWDLWHDKAPPGFRFAVKASRYISHVKRFEDCEKPVQRFVDGAERLKAHLGPVLYQTPPNFQRDEENAKRLRRFLALLPRHCENVIEFRHNSWFKDEALADLREQGIGFCIHDMQGMDCPVLTTANFAYLRFHGSERPYSGSYSDSELERWARRIEQLSEEVARVWVYFNNDLEGAAPANAQTLRSLLGDVER